MYGARGGASNLNYYTETGGAASVTFGPVYESVVSLDYQPGKDFRTELKVVPWLAESWQRVDPTTYLFQVRRDAVWHDGAPITAADVVFSYQYARDPNNKFVAGSLLSTVDRIEMVDGHTFRLTTKGPSPLLLHNLAGTSLPIYPKHVAERGSKFEEVAIGSGPFRLEKFDRQSGATYVRHERYWRPDSPFIDGIKVVWPLDDAALLAAFATGNNDILQLQDKPQLDSARAVARDLQYGEYVNDSNDALYLRRDRAPFDDIRTRKAIHLAVDRQAILNIAWAGLGGINPPGMNGARTGWVIPQEELLKLPGYRQPKDQDLAEAKRLLAEAGYAQGLRFSLKYVQSFPRIPQNSQIIADQLRQIGTQVDLKPMERSAFLKDQQQGDFDAIYNPVGSFTPEHAWRNYFHSKGALNPGRVADAELDRLIEQLEMALEEDEQKRLYIAIQKLLFEKVYVVSTISPTGFAAWQPWVKDYVFNSLGQAYPRNWADIKLDTARVPSNR